MDLQIQRDEIFVPSIHGGARAGSGRTPGSRTKSERQPDVVQPPVVLTRAEEREHWRSALAKAKETGNIREQREILQYINEMRRGKPYQAVNPRERKQKPADNRIMIAVQALMGNQRQLKAEVKRGRGRPRKAKP